MIPRLILIFSLSVALGPAAASRVDFALPDLNQQTVRLADFQGKWVVVNFWATWCPPCLQELPELEAFYQKYKDDKAVVIGVNFESSDLAKLREFIARLSLSFPIVTSAGEPLPGFELIGLPTTFLVSPEGQLVTTHTGPVTAAMLEDLIGGTDKN